MTEIVRTHGLGFKYSKQWVVEDLELRLERGDIFGFVGPNGAGKTTTIKLLLGLLSPTHGTVEIFGMPLRSRRLSILRKIGCLVEMPSLYPHLTAEENLEVLRCVRDVPKARIAAVLAQAGLAAHRAKRVKEFSLGMKQRLGIAQALLHEPELLILDEPTNGLDPEGIQELRALLLDMSRQRGTTLLVSSHILSELEHVANTVGVISEGRLRYQGSLEELKRRQHGLLRIGVKQVDAAVSLIRAGGGVVARLDGSVFSLEVGGADEAGEWNRRLVQAGIEVFHLSLEQANLEQAFMRLVRGGAGENP